MSGIAHVFEDDTAVIDASDTEIEDETENESVEYVFEGFDVEFSEKVTLMPISVIGTHSER